MARRTSDRRPWFAVLALFVLPLHLYLHEARHAADARVPVAHVQRVRRAPSAPDPHDACPPGLNFSVFHSWCHDGGGAMLHACRGGTSVSGIVHGFAGWTCHYDDRGALIGSSYSGCTGADTVGARNDCGNVKPVNLCR